MNESTELTNEKMRQELQEAVGTLLIKAQNESNPHALANVNPGKWMIAASRVLCGAKPFDLRRDIGFHHDLANSIYGFVSTHDDSQKFRLERARQLAYQAANTAELQDKIIAHLTSDEAADRVKEFGPKELQQLALAQKLSQEQFDRVTGNNVQKIEVRHITTPEEAMSLIDSLPEADVEEVLNV